MSTTRKQAPRPARPAARYWKGKAPKGLADVAADSDSDEESLAQDEDGDIAIGGEQDIVEEDEEAMPIRTDPVKAVKGMNIALRDVNIRDGKVIVAGREESGRTAMEEDESDEDEEDERLHSQIDRKAQSDESSEYESESEEEEKPKPQFRPVFVPKRGRVTILEKEAIAQDTEEALKKKEMEAEERRKQSHDLVAESIKRELAEKEKEEIIPDVDDTDGLDPTAEFEAWRLRELGRIKREKEEDLRREEEREEIERRRALPEEQRLKEDLERAQKLREDKPKGQQRFLQKYWHKGAFHQDEEILQRHDFTQPTESTVDVSLLPKVMQVKNFGKRSRTKYTHLLDQDTTSTTGGFGGAASVKAGGKSTDGGGCFQCGGPHLKKDCPQNTGPLPLSGRGSVGSGANAAPTSAKKWDTGRESGSWRDREGSGSFRPSERPPEKDSRPNHSLFNRNREASSDRRDEGERVGKNRYDDDRRNSRRRSRTRSRSRSPRQTGHEHRDGRGYVERSGDNRYRDKRRRLD